MNPTKEELQASLYEFKYMLRNDMKVSDLRQIDIDVISTLLDEAISKMEPTTEQSSGVETHNMPEVIYAGKDKSGSTFWWRENHPAINGFAKGMEPTKYTRAEQPKVDLSIEYMEGLHSKIDMDIEDAIKRELSIEESSIVGKALRLFKTHITTHYTLTKRGV